MSETKLSRHYPKWITSKDGNRMIVPNHIHHGIMIGKEVLEDGTVVERPTPPSLETVLATGYQEPRASQIVAEEQEKFEKGYKPYGDIEPPKPQCNMVDVSRGACTLSYGHPGDHTWEHPEKGKMPDLLSEQPIKPAVEEKSSLDEPPKEPVRRGPGRPPKAAVAESKAW